MESHRQLEGFFDPEILISRAARTGDVRHAFEDKLLLGNYWFQFHQNEEVKIRLTKGINTFLVIRLKEFEMDGKPRLEKSFREGEDANFIDLDFYHVKYAGLWGTTVHYPLTEIKTEKNLLTWMSYLFTPHELGVFMQLAIYGAVEYGSTIG